MKVGDQLYVVMYKGNNRYHTIEKIGRKYLHLSHMPYDLKVHKDSLVIEHPGYGNSGQCYSSKEEYELICDTNKKWDEFKKIVWNMSKPQSIIRDDIEQLIMELNKFQK